MKCESCGNEMIGAAIICRACNHNNALHKRLALRRSEPRYDKSTRSQVSGAPAPAELPTIVPRKDTDLNLLHFPSAQNKRSEVSQAPPARQTMDESQPQTAKYPPWRAELKERVRRIMEKRATGERVTPNKSSIQSSRAQTGETKLGRNPIVEAALNRIRWAEREREKRGDRATDRQADSEKNLSAPTSPRRPVALSPAPSVPASPRSSVSTFRASSKISTSKASVSGPLAGGTDKQVRTRVSEIALAHESSTPKADPAPLHARLLAGVCDFEIVFVAFLLIFGAYATSNNPTSFVYGSRLLMALLFSAVIFTYQIVMLALAGRTFGMALLNLNLVNTGDESLPVTFWQKLLRASAATIVFICFPLYLTAWFSVSRRTLPDLVSGTTVA
jgi:uncharacterized RDD family membrane protein YckC